MNDTPYTALGDEPVEARIVAWVLGEASAFEVAELERLCDEHPELLVFRRRMLALHGLLGEAVAAQPDAEWKLRPDQREVLDGLVGVAHVVRLEQRKEQRIRHLGRRALLAIAACLLLTAVALVLLAPAGIRKTEETLAMMRHGGTRPFVAAPADRAPSIAKLDQAVREQENKVEDRRKVLATIERTQGAIDKGGDSFYGQPDVNRLKDSRKDQAIKRGLDAQDYVDAKRDYDSDRQLLQMMKQKRSELAGVSTPGGDDAFASSRSHPAKAMARGLETERLAKNDEPARAKRELGAQTKIAAGNISASSAPMPSAPAPAAAPKLAEGQARMDPYSRTESEVEALSTLSRAAPIPHHATLDLADRDTGRIAAGKKSLAESKPAAPAAMPVLGARFAGKANDRNRAAAGQAMGYASVVNGSIAADGPPGADGSLRESGQGAAANQPARSAALGDESQAKDRANKPADSSGLSLDAKELAKAIRVQEDKLPEESAAAEDPYSTFSLNISDASFQVALAALARGERPDPAGIQVEQFYNAVDYGDPSPMAGEPVAVAIEQAAHPVIPGRNLVRVALKTAADGRAASQALRLTLLVDQSGSMVRDDRRAAMERALGGLAGLLTPDDRVTVIGFARTPRLLADGWTGPQAAKLSELVNQSASEGGTNLEEALKLAEVMAERRQLAGAQNRIVLFTDGAVNLGDADPAHLANRVKALRQKGISFDIAGIVADGLNDELLGELARHGNGRYYVVGKGADDGFARQLAGALRPAAENVKVQVRFNPGRVGHYQLIGFEKDRLQTEDFRNDAVDAAELAADEAGVAVYQVEPLPGGAGELGEVSVRFRDTASGQMVERSWTIPYEAGAPALDRAAPSMQLAVLALLAAEKLRGGPLAEAIDFKQLSAPRANVKRAYGNAGRVAEMLNLLNSL